MKAKDKNINLGRKLSSATSPKQAARFILEAAERLLGWDCAYVHFYSQEEQRFYRTLVIDLVRGKKVEFPIPFAPLHLSPFMAKVIAEGAQLILRGPNDRSAHGLIPFGDTSRLSAAVLIVPIRENKKTTGVLYIGSYTRNAYNQEDLATLQSLADHCGGAFERLNAQAALRASETKLRALAARLQSVREEESIRIAREIHDEMGQAMTGLKMDLAWLGKKLAALDRPTAPLSERIQSMVKITDDTLKAVRRICTELRPGVLDDLGLVAAINWHTSEFAARTGVECRLSLPKQPIKVENRMATAIFRILQELLTNVARHSEATAVSIQLEKTRENIALKVRDNGRGLPDIDAESKSFGLLGIRERLLVFGGEFFIGNTHPPGASAEIVIPLSSRAKKGHAPPS